MGLLFIRIKYDTLELYLTNDPFKNKDISIFGKIYLSINSK